MKQYNVTGMSCAACSARVEKAVSGLEGVTSCSVNLLTNSMGVEGTVSEKEVIAAVERAGYGASVKGKETSKEDTLKDRETPLLIKRLIASVGFLLILMYISMGHSMWGFPLPSFMAENPMVLGILQLVLAAVVMVINNKFFINGFKGLIRLAPNMDTLVALGSGAAFVYSTAALFLMGGAISRGDTATAHTYLHGLYFESAAMILALITVGKTLEARSKGKTTDAIKSLMDLSPKTATLIRDDKEVTLPAEEVVKGDIFVVRPGESFPVDGIIIEGSCAVDEAALTGESVPVDKAEGDGVSAATVNKWGFVKCQATGVGEDTALARIIKTVTDAAATKAPIAKIADKVSGVFVPVVMGIALITVAAWLIGGQTLGYALARGISVLVISCPCALGLATPVAITVGSGRGARYGLLFKTAQALEEMGRIDLIALDKTGTVTQGNPTLTDIIPAEGVSEEELLTLAYSLESKSEHPLARAVVRAAEERGYSPKEVTDFKALAGNGLSALMEGKSLVGGKEGYIKTITALPSFAEERAKTLSEEGKTPLFFALDGRFLGVMGVADVLKEESQKSIEELKNMGVKVVMLTGDNSRTAAAVGKKAGVDDVVADLMPDDKAKAVINLKKEGKVAMVGDGINDAPALTAADVGIAIGAGTDVAIDAADCVLMKSRLDHLPAALRLSRATLRIIKENLFWAFIYNVIGIPLAAGLFIPILGWELNPMFGAAAMSLSSFCVVSNALRLNLFDPFDSRKDKKKRRTHKQKEIKSMTKVMKIEGMMCGHCEARVKKVLEALDAVEMAEVSHVAGTATLTLKSDVDNALLTKTVEDQDYKVIGIE